MKLIYIAHPFKGKQENVDKVEKIIKGLIHKHPDCTFYSPLHATVFFYNQLNLDGMEHCIDMLCRCDELWLCGDYQEIGGYIVECSFAKAKGIPIKIVTE
jgi:hypothetical protein